MHRLRSQSATDFVIMASLLLGRLLFLLSSPAGLSGDAFGYVAVAQTLIDSGELPDLGMQPHGYPLLIAPLLAMGLDVSRAMLIMNALMDCSIVALLFWIAGSILPEQIDRSPRFLCWLLAAIQPFSAEMVSSVYTETPTMFFVFVGVWLIFIQKNVFGRIMGFVFLGIASLLRIDILVLNIVAIIAALALLRRKSLDLRTIILGLVLFCALPFSMLSYQYYSTHEIGFVKPEFRQSGYYAWMRSWFARQKVEHDRFAFSVGSPTWDGFDVANYPLRAFDSTTERDRVAELLSTWRTGGYTRSVDQGFERLAFQKFQQRPLRSLVLVPLLRMINYWINIDGAQTFLRVVHLEWPVSTMIVALTISLRLLLLFLAVIGVYAVWLQPRPPALIDQVLLVRFASLFVVLRTAELGVLGTIAWGGLMEVRYVLVAFPFLMLLSFWGIRYISRMRIDVRTLPPRLNH